MTIGSHVARLGEDEFALCPINADRENEPITAGPYFESQEILWSSKRWRRGGGLGGGLVGQPVALHQNRPAERPPLAVHDAQDLPPTARFHLPPGRPAGFGI